MFVRYLSDVQMVSVRFGFTGRISTKARPRCDTLHSQRTGQPCMSVRARHTRCSQNSLSPGLYGWISREWTYSLGCMLFWYKEQTQHVKHAYETYQCYTARVYVRYIPTASQCCVLPWWPPHPASGNTFQLSNARSKSGTPIQCVAWHKDSGSNLGMETGYRTIFFGIFLRALIVQKIWNGGLARAGWLDYQHVQFFSSPQSTLTRTPPQAAYWMISPDSFRKRTRIGVQGAELTIHLNLLSRLRWNGS